MNTLTSREWIILTVFLTMIFSLVIIAKVSDVKADKETIKVLSRESSSEHSSPP
ncbi:MAG: hypothetical protein AB7N99_03215 [Simkaniaceae bacterium]|jgi:hypothetical protein